MVALGPAEQCKPGALYTELFGHLERARELSVDVGDAVGAGRDLAILGLAQPRTLRSF